MDTDEIKYFPATLAKIISIIFHPLLMPVYGLAIVFSAPTLFGYLPFELKRLLFFIILINNVLLPSMLLPVFRYRNIISSWTIEERKERIIPLLITTLLYASSSYIIFRFPIPFFLKTFILSIFLLSSVITIISLWWKVSVHAVGAGAIVALVFILSSRMYTSLVLYTVFAILAAGLVLSSRLRLNSHNPWQVWIGFFTGLLGLAASMLILQ
jgi:hypothetical protein